MKIITSGVIYAHILRNINHVISEVDEVRYQSTLLNVREEKKYPDVIERHQGCVLKFTANTENL